jgi:hypothetical protein
MLMITHLGRLLFLLVQEFDAGETVILKVKNLSYPCNTVFADSSYLTDDSSCAMKMVDFVVEWTVCDCPGDSLRLKAAGQDSGLLAYVFFHRFANSQ